MKLKKMGHKLENIRLLVTVILTVVLSTIAQSCQLFPDRRNIDSQKNDDITEPLRCQELVIAIDLTSSEPSTIDAESIIVNNLTGAECSRGWKNNDNNENKPLTIPSAFAKINR